MTDQTITNIHFLDCNRQNSEEYVSGDDTTPASWNNVVSGGLKLNAGDKISVAYSSINEVGCGSGAIETKGKAVGEISYENGTLKGDLTDSPQGSWEYGPFASEYTEYKLSTKKKMIKDNEFNVVVSYYKTTNGENYIHLPRRYDSKIDLALPVECDKTGTQNSSGAQGWKSSLYERNQIWTQGDGITNGRPHKIPFIRCFEDWHWYMGYKRYVPHSAVLIGGMAHKTDGKLSLIEGNERTPCSSYWDDNMWKQKNDNARYTIFFAQEQYWNYAGMSAGQRTRFDQVYSSRDPAVQIYHQYKELKEYEVTTGFNDPNNVAYQLTSQFSDPVLGPQPRFLHQKGHDNTATTGEGADSIRVVPNFPCPFTTTSVGETYKPFPASNYSTMSRGIKVGDTGYTDADSETGAWVCYSNGNSLANQTGTTDVIKNRKREDVVGYQSAYHCIGVKRPEFFNAGRKYELQGLSAESVGQKSVMANNWNTLDTTAIVSTQRWIKTNIDFDEDVLKRLSTFLKTQALYPELLDFAVRNQDSTQQYQSALHKMDTPSVVPDLLTSEQDPDNVVNPIPSVFHKRFLHLDPFNYNMAQRIDGKFGDDMTYYDQRTGSGDDAWVSISTASLPLWFYYDPTMENTYVENFDATLDLQSQDASDDAIDGDLCYGFAKMWINGAGEKLVALNWRGNTDEMVKYCGYNGMSHGGKNILKGNYIGYDLHFNAYGNSCIQLYSGVLPQNYDGKQMVGQNSQGQPEETSTGSDITKWTPNGGPSQVSSLGHVGTPFQPMGYSISRILKQVYIGAIDPIIQFVSANSRFTFAGLHTPEQIQNGNNTGSPLDATSNVQPEADAGTDVYKINKRFTMWNNYTPEILPYRTEESYKAPFHDTKYYIGRRDTAVVNAIHANIVGQTGGKLKEKTDTYGGIETKSYLCENSATDWSETDPNAQADATTSNNFQSAGGPDGGGLFAGKSNIVPLNGYSRTIDEVHNYEEINNNISPYIIYDAHSGIFLEDFGDLSERQWEASLFGTMGFSYSQMNPTADIQMNRQSKLTRVNYKNVKPLTTNALVPQKDLPTFIKNLWQAPMYSQQLPISAVASLWYGMVGDFQYYDGGSGILESNFPTNDGWGTPAGDPPSAGRGIARRIFHIGDVNMPCVVPEVVNPQTSHSIMCDGLPIKMKSAYYLVKSDLLTDAYYLREKTPLPIVAVINKENFFGDYAFSQQSQIEYTITQQKTITSIRTEIYDADMTYASVGKNSGIIYKITKQIPINPNLVQELLQGNGNPKKGVIDMNIDAK
tara:strand:+ start:5233 stop:9081 length:3849 start_codon:yes stop_codon:yes gene_type:complete